MSTFPPGSPFAELPQRARCWQLRTRTLNLPRQPLLMGILNVTPDSFSDGGRFFDPRAAIDAGLALAAAGADLLDVGGESTRPYAEPVSEAEELRRVLPIVQALAERLDVPVSIDTSKAAVAREALAAGAEIINDITALAGDPEMLPLAVASRSGLCIMHMQGTPQTMQDAPHYDDVVAEVFSWLAARRDACLAAGVEPQRLASTRASGSARRMATISSCWPALALPCAGLSARGRPFPQRLYRQGAGRQAGRPNRRHDRRVHLLGSAGSANPAGPRRAGGTPGARIVRRQRWTDRPGVGAALGTTGDQMACSTQGTWRYRRYVGSRRPSSGRASTSTPRRVQRYSIESAPQGIVRILLPVLSAFCSCLVRANSISSGYIARRSSMAVVDRQDLRDYCLELAKRAQAAAAELVTLTGAQKQAWLRRAAQLLRERQAELQAANALDVSAADGNGLSSAQIDRLRLSSKTIEGMATALEEVAAQSEPIGEIIESTIRPNGLEVQKVRVPLGVVFFIYESRPNVTADAAAICVKSGNAVILRGGKEAAHSNQAIAQLLAEAAAECSLPADAVQLVGTTDRDAVGHLLALPEYINLAIPRGGESLIRRVAAEARMPVIKHFTGNCHVYVDESADLEMAERITVNAKCQRLGVCNAAESLIVHAAVAERFLRA